MVPHMKAAWGLEETISTAHEGWVGDQRRSLVPLVKAGWGLEETISTAHEGWVEG